LSSGFAEERTEQPTSRRKEFFRSSGIVAHSYLFAAAVSFFGCAIAIRWFGQPLIERLMAVSVQSFTFHSVLENKNTLFTMLAVYGWPVYWSLLPVVVLPVVGSVLGSLLLTGPYFNLSYVQPRWSRILSFTRMSQIFSMTHVFSILLSGLCCGIFAVVSAGILMNGMTGRLAFSQLSVHEIAIQISRELSWFLLVISFSACVIATVDYGFQLWKYYQKLRMTRLEHRDDMRDTEGDPRIRTQRRTIHRKVSEAHNR